MHNVDSRSLRYVLCWSGFIASLILLACSGAMNFQYGYSLGTTDLNRAIYGGAAAAADVLMALSPFFFFAAWKNREYTRSFAASVLWAITTVFAAQSAVGHAAVNRLDVMSERTVVATSYKDIRADIEQARKDRGFVPIHRPEATVRAEIEKLKTQQHWWRSSECTEIAGKAQREFCSSYQTLNAELGYAMQATKLDARIDGLTAKSDKAGSTNATKVASEADPQAKFLALVSGAELRSVQGLLTIMVVLMILAGAGLGPYVSMALLPGPAASSAQTATPPPLPTLPLEAEPLKALPAPASRQVRDPKAITIRANPTPEWRALLDRLDFPPGGTRHKGPRRPKDPRDHVALRFLAWLGAYKEGGDYSAGTLNDLYAEFCSMDHRDEWSSKIVKAELRVLGDKVASGWTGADGAMWTITPPPIDKLTTLLQRRGALPDDAKGRSVIKFAPRGGDAA